MFISCVDREFEKLNMFGASENKNRSNEVCKFYPLDETDFHPKHWIEYNQAAMCRNSYTRVRCTIRMDLIIYAFRPFGRRKATFDKRASEQVVRILDWFQVIDCVASHKWVSDFLVKNINSDFLCLPSHTTNTSRSILV